MKRPAASLAPVAVLLFALVPTAMVQPAKVAQPGDFPDRPLRLVTGFPPSGVSDTLARIIGVQLGEQKNQRIVVDARPGAGGMLAMELTANATPDGYTIYLAQPGVVISRLSSNKPSGKLLRVTGNARLVHVAYKGASANTIAVVQGEIPVAFQPLAGAIPHLKAGRLKGLALTGSKRSPAVPDLPTVGETIKGYAVDSWYGFVAPAKTPQAVINYLKQQTNVVLARQDVIDSLSRNGVGAEDSTPAAFGQLMRDEAVKWEKRVRAAGIKLD